MSYDLAVWEGELPADDGAAGVVYDQLYAAYMEREELPPTPRIRAYVLALLERWVDMPDDEHDVSPWSAGPLMDEASGPFVYFTMRYSMCEEVSAEAARMAADHGLVCYDPQWERLRPTADEAAPRAISVPLGQASQGQTRPSETVATRQPTSWAGDHRQFPS
ncbi:hypothetical protein [Micromonospora purpureochromogenes]|uniref:Uncharacterized protein n=1 Tax=Micromonospora purpureochromogenes TaxID=47872 RepID=A0ABX2RJH4_9ACTN|nr:hypothetical protein [Micromonospora purpureochromogenes]NYF56153.1 hypothetical protein [Micromonospora purpureochromogenes]